MNGNKIDLVYLWVDGSDPKWLAKKNAALVAAGRKTMDISAISDDRFRDSGELKYSLRSAARFAPWINHIFIITDGQTPGWLNAKNPKISIIDHSDIIPERYLPTFNASAIELFLHKIPGLSEHFLFANDDMFFWGPTGPDFFFDENGNPIYRVNLRKWGRKGADLFDRMTMNGIFLCLNKTGIKYDCRQSHGIDAYRRSFFAAEFEENKRLFMNTTATKFRGAANMQRIFFSLVDNARRGCPIILADRFMGRKIKYPRRRHGLWRLFLGAARTLGLAGSDVMYFSRGDVKRARRHSPRVICANYADKSDIEFIAKKFPEKSEFEK
jgi:transposase